MFFEKELSRLSRHLFQKYSDHYFWRRWVYLFMRFLKFLHRRFGKRSSSCVVIEDYQGAVKLALNPHGHLGGQIYWQGAHHMRELNYLKNQIKPRMIFLDIGANIGEFTLAVASWSANTKVIALEPSAYSRSFLSRSLELNGFSNVEVLTFGLDSQSSERTLYASLDPGSRVPANEGLLSMHPFRDATPFERIQVRTLDDYMMGRPDITRLDFVKIDIEGNEVAAIMGAKQTLLRFKPKLIIEINGKLLHLAKTSTTELIGLLEVLGYRSFFDFEVSRIDREEILKASHGFNVLVTADEMAGGFS